MNKKPQRRSPRTDLPKKQCQGKCERNRSHTFFYKVDSPMYPDGMLNLCRDCIRDEVNIEDTNEVIAFLRQINKPFIQKYWDAAMKNREDKHPLGSYMGKINGLHQAKNKDFTSSKGVDGVGKHQEFKAPTVDVIYNIKEEPIEFNDKLVAKWGEGYKQSEYLKMEKFFQDMRLTHDIHTPVHVNKLMELAYLSIEQERLRRERNIGDYTKLAAAIEKMETNAGFSPKDRQSIDDATGMRSFSQIWEEVEKEGFRKPPKVVFEEDIIDGIIISLSNYYHRIVGKQILSELPDDMRDELDDFYEIDETPVDLNDDEYDNMDFSFDEEEVDIIAEMGLQISKDEEDDE